MQVTPALWDNECQLSVQVTRGKYLFNRLYEICAPYACLCLSSREEYLYPTHMRCSASRRSLAFLRQYVESTSTASTTTAAWTTGLVRVSSGRFSSIGVSCMSLPAAVRAGHVKVIRHPPQTSCTIILVV